MITSIPVLYGHPTSNIHSTSQIHSPPSGVSTADVCFPSRLEPQCKRGDSSCSSSRWRCMSHGLLCCCPNVGFVWWQWHTSRPGQSQLKRACCESQSHCRCWTHLVTHTHTSNGTENTQLAPAARFLGPWCVIILGIAIGDSFPEHQNIWERFQPMARVSSRSHLRSCNKFKEP